VTASIPYLLAALLGTGGLRIETVTPEALCPPIASVQQAIAARIGQVEGTGEWRASYGLVHRPEGEQADVVRLQLYDPAGALRLTRDLPRAGPSCAAVTQAMVVMLESFFRRTAEPGPLPPAADTGAVVVAARAPPPPPAPRRVTPAVDVLGGWAGGPSSAAVVTSLRLTGIFGGPWQTGLGAAWPLATQTQAIGSGSVSQRSFVFRLHVGRRWTPHHLVTARLGPELVVVLDHATTTGVPEGTSPFRAGAGIGAGGGLEARLSSWLALSLVGAADLTPAAWSGEYVIESYSGAAILPPPRWRFLAALGLTVSRPE
jgi:hypothetical protein